MSRRFFASPRPLLAGLALLLTLTTLPAPAVFAADTRPPMVVNSLTPYVEQKLAKGDPVVLLKSAHPIYHLDVYGLIDGTPDEVWTAITSYANYNEFLPLVTESAVRKRTGDTIYQYLQMNPPWPFHEQIFVNANTEDKATYTLRFELTEGNVKMERGFWNLKAQPGGKTRMQYHLTVDPWMDSMPSWVVEMVTKTIMPEIVKGVRKRVKLNQQANK